MFSTEAFGLIQANLPVVLREPNDLEARGHMLKAAAFAGIAIENSMLGAAHSMANPLTAHYGIAHGQAVAMMLPNVVRYNAGQPETAAEYAALARTARLCPADTADAEAVDVVVARVESLLAAAGFEPSLGAYGVPTSAGRDLADEAARQWTAQYNPRPVSAADFRKLFAMAGLA
jgi:alcohol dehydrogenase